MGVTFEWSELGDVEALGRVLVVLGVASLVAKLVPSALLLLLGLRFRAVFAGAFLLATPLTLLVAIAALGREMEVIDASTSAAVILLAIVTGVVFPTLFKLLAPREVIAEDGPTSPPDLGGGDFFPE